MMWYRDTSVVEKNMKVLRVVVLCLLVGCAARTPLAELEEEALMTGDWSKVEKHEKMNRQMNRVLDEPACPRGLALACHAKGEKEVCDCVSPRDLRNQP